MTTVESAMASSVGGAGSAGPQPLFTCNTCSIGFPVASLQRQHMKTDWHRYNLKRRVAGLPPVAAELFSERVIQQQTISQQDADRLAYVNVCRACGGKRFTSEGAYRNHIASQKHRENERDVPAAAGGSVIGPRAGRLAARAAARASRDRSTASSASEGSEFSLGEPVGYRTAGYRDARVSGGGKVLRTRGPSTAPSESGDNMSELGSELSRTLTLESDESDEAEAAEPTEQELTAAVAAKLATAVELAPEECLFCGAKQASLEASVEHMYRTHGLFIPERDYLVDLAGLVKYLGEKMAIGNFCLACSFEGRSLAAVRHHMLAKDHCKIPFESEDDQYELSDYYDFSASYPDASGAHDGDTDEEVSDDEWSDDEGEGDGAYIDATGTELAIPSSGIRVGHRSMARYYRQTLRAPVVREDQRTVIAADMRTASLRLTDPKAYKLEKMTYKQNAYEDKKFFKRKLKNTNQQKHFRDPLLQ
ncbi:Rei1p [Dipodascopsis tothii]|uniref:Rei1p n=1 Tax=Dipodascopsis tothii TaxID=44089 RepID=UPI0034CFBB8B